jgi:phosphatidylinositol-3-phosphatase
MWGWRRLPTRRQYQIWLAGAGLLALAACGAAPTAGPPAPGPSDASSPARPQAPAATSTDNATATVPTPDHVVVVVLENKDVDQVLGTGETPFLDHLAQTGADFTNAHAEMHPSQPNYLALFSGSTQGVSDDSCLPGLTAPNLATQLHAYGRTFIGYSESLPAAGFTGCHSGEYAQRHSPWAAFTNLPPGANQPWSAWPASFDQLPTVAFVTPNLCSDMHDCAVQVGDQWLRENLSDYVDWAHTHNSLLIVTFDESESTHGGNGIVTLIDGARVRPREFDEPVDHYRLLRTIEQMYRMPPLGHAAATAPITDIWTS